MNNTALATRSEIHRQLLPPEPRSGPISIRAAVPGGADLKFIDGLLKKHTKMVGWMPTKQIEKRIEDGWFLIAEDASHLAPGDSPGAKCPPVGYVLATDKYFKRDDCGIIYQLNVAPHKQRGLIGASLIKAVFERSSYACRLYCCWCAQDLAANFFWESIGFVPLAFRAGSRGVAQGGRRKEGRIHIFWQKRIREGDVSTPYWFPSETKGGALKEARIVLPMLAGTHWSEAKPMVLPGTPAMEASEGALGGLQLESDAEKPKRKRGERRTSKTDAKAKAVKSSKDVSSGGLWCPSIPSPAAQAAKDEAKAKRAEEKRQRAKNDPKYVEAARELCDRYLEEINSEGGDGRCMIESQWAAAGKYDVSRQLPSGCKAGEMKPVQTAHLLDAA